MLTDRTPPRRAPLCPHLPSPLPCLSNSHKSDVFPAIRNSKTVTMVLAVFYPAGADFFFIRPTMVKMPSCFLIKFKLR